ncbi:tetratricopeptide repeat protein [Pelomonas sp. CA6]|uniref:tetratricopeptide repeat protein n=1 Tax=Pelomonas sp. CA6 TaxID=2907999 RepID=UPI001F4C3C86|nr:tetratricopeptide repeat protein [Pelomonas sp. CA6]MCH7344220.1 tetratricopeptide repeat protein [Pelomonas sp. CA6]
MRQTMWAAVLGAASLVMAGCATSPASLPAPSDIPLLDQRFGGTPPPALLPSAHRVTDSSEAMRAYLRDRIQPQARLKDPRRGLLEALYTQGELKLEYDSDLTRTADEAFDARSGNCLSLALMTAAFARDMGLPVQFRMVFNEAQWSRSGDLEIYAGHINLALGRKPGEMRVLGDDAAWLVVDFLPGEDLRKQRVMELDERTVIAMYYNNRAAELLSRGELRQAYWWARAAVNQDPRFMAGLNTLGVVYRRAGEQATAEHVFRQVLAREPGNVQALSNLIGALRVAGRQAEADGLGERLAQLQPYPPFRFYDLGLEAMRAGDYAKARELFQREISRTSGYHDFYFWLALSYYGSGDLRGAREAMRQAEASSTSSSQRQLYAAKLAHLQAQIASQRRQQ